MAHHVARRSLIDRYPERFSFNHTGYRANAYSRAVREEAERALVEALRVRAQADEYASAVRHAAVVEAANLVNELALVVKDFGSVKAAPVQMIHQPPPVPSTT